MAEQLDQDVINLAKAIRQVETGNRPVSGASGELASRYQFMPATWKSAAAKHLGNANAPLTLENENKVAYLRIKEWKDAGYGPDQIASMWNSGKPDWKGKVGVNKAGVRYDVPGYVAKVGTAYGSIKGQAPTAAPQAASAAAQQAPAAPRKSVFGRVADVAKAVPAVVEDVATGAGKGVLSTLRGAASLGERGLYAATRALLPKQLEGAFGVSKPLEKTAAEELVPEAAITPTTAAQKVGFVGEQIGEFLIPGGAATKAGKAAEAAAVAAKAGRLQRVATTLGVRATAEAGLAAGQTAIQKGKIDKEAALSAGIAAASPLAAKALSWTTRGAGKVLSEALGKSTGAGSQPIVEAFNNPSVRKYAAQAGRNVAGFQDEVLANVRTGLSTLRNVRGSKYRAALEKVSSAKKAVPGVVTKARDIAREALSDFGVTVVPRLDEATGKKLNALDFSQSTLIEGSNIAERALNDVLGWTDETAAGLDTLKKRLGTYADQLSAPGKGAARSIVVSLKSAVQDGLENGVKGYKKMTESYRQASDVIDEIDAAFSLKNKKASETAIKKVFGAMRQNNENRAELLRFLDRALGGDAVAKVAGAQLSAIAPRGLAGAISPAGLAVGGVAASQLFNPSAWPLLFTYIAASSPRLMGEAAVLAGKITRQMRKTGKYSPALQRAIRELFLKARAAAGIEEGGDMVE